MGKSSFRSLLARVIGLMVMILYMLTRKKGQRMTVLRSGERKKMTVLTRFVTVILGSTLSRNMRLFCLVL
ncbi:hypothetical protein D3C77_436130 [compost metagenome]